MKLFTNKKLIPKITIVMVFLILFNFIVPTYSRAGVVDAIAEGAESIGEALAPIINVFARLIGDGILTVVQKMFIGTDPFVNDEINIAISPGKIFSGMIYVLDIDFISNKNIDTTITNNNDDTNTNTNVSIKDIENEKWYKKYNEFCLKVTNIMEKERKGTEKYNACNIILLKIDKRGDAEQIIKTMNELYELNTEEKLLDWLEPTDGYEENGTNEETVQEIIGGKIFSYKSLLKIIGYYKNYKGKKVDDDPALYFASKPENAPAYVLHDTIATWYKIMRNIALVFLLSVLVYVGIRIMLSSTAADNTKYKKMLVDWVAALCILFVLHYLMAFTINITKLIVDAFSGNNVTIVSNDEIMQAVRNKAATTGTTGLGYTLLYLVLIFYTIYFLFYYVKRVVYIAFLTLIAPLVSLTYPIDKMGDSKAQAFEMWLREYIMNVIVQPIHLLIYTTMVSSALSLAENNPIYAIVVIGAMIPAENFIKEMFGLNSKKGPKGGFLAGATTMGLMQKFANKKPPKFGHHPGENEKGGIDKTQEKVQKPRMDGEKQAEFSRAVTGSNTSVTNASSTKSKSIRTEDLPDINNGDYSSNRDTGNEKGDLPKPGDIRLSDLDTTSDQNKEWDLGDDKQKNIGQDDGLPKSEDIKLDNLDVAADKNREWDLSDEEQSGIVKNDFSEISKNEKNLDTNRNMPLAQNNDNPETTEEPKKKSIRGAAVGATVNHYARKIVNGKNLKKLGRGLVKTGLGAVAAGTGAAIGLAAGIATGDPSKAWQYAAAGVVAGSKIGANAGDGIANLAGGVLDIKDTYKAQKNEIIKHDKKAQKAEIHKKNKKYATSAETKAEIKKRYPKLSKEEMEKRQNAIVRYRDAGVDDLDIIFNSYNLERGIDSDGKKIGTELSPEHAMYIAQMASSMDDSASSRKSIENSMQTQFAQNYEKDGMDSEMAMTQAKALRKREMQYVDMAKGKTVKEAVSIAEQAEINKKAEDRKEEKAAEMQARLNANAQNNVIIKNKQIRTRNGRINIKDSVITNGNNGNVTINAKDINAN